MQPKIVNAEIVTSFHISPEIVANLFTNIESAGVIQYYHILVFFGEDRQPCLFTGSEWSKFAPEHKDLPVFGIFLDGGHASQDGSSDWLDSALFVLHSIEYARDHLGITSSDLSDGEAWALTKIMKNLNEGNQVQHFMSYKAILSKYDDRIAKCFQRNIPNGSILDLLLRACEL